MLSNRSWAVVRVILGQLQVIGATASLLLVAQFGVTEMIIWLAGSIVMVSLLSVFLFRILKIEARTWTESELASMKRYAAEFLGTFALVFVNVSTGAKEKGITAGMAVGSVIALEALFGGLISGASMNPARSLAPPLVTANLESLWIYLGAPTLGALLAVPTCRCVHEKGCCDAVTQGT